MKLLVLGASGNVGRMVVAEALKRGHTVQAFVHSASLPAQDGLLIFHGDIYDRASIQKASRGCDAVISALGSWGTPKQDVLSAAMTAIVHTLPGSGIRRIVSLTGAGAAVPGEHLPLSIRLANLPLRIAAPKVLRDGQDHIRILHGSKLEWTVLRSPVMRSGTAVTYRLDSKKSGLVIARGSVAKAMVDLVESNDWIHKTPFIR